ncbi:hypothetical protein QZH41_006732 [Actinostola sp. cb2023]|nr:hypothetical protein QZH41_006732 [Actinostola sp. cb2023]
MNFWREGRRTLGEKGALVTSSPSICNHKPGEGVIQTSNKLNKITKWNMKTYSTVAIQTDINGVDDNEELAALFAKALDLCNKTDTSHADSSSSNIQYHFSSDNVTYCVTNVESIDLQPIPLLEIGENDGVSMKAILTQINQENDGDDVSDDTEDFVPDDVASESDNEDDDVSDDTDDFELPDDVANESDESSINSDQDVTKHSKKKKKCPVCGKLYISEGPYNRHIKTHEKEGNPDTEVENGTEKHTKAKRECTHCGKMYSSQSALNRHLKKLKEKKASNKSVDKTQMAGTSTVEGETTGDQGKVVAKEKIRQPRKKVELEGVIHTSNKLHKITKWNMKTYSTVAIQTDINGVDNNEELAALFAKALDLCNKTDTSHADSSSSNIQYFSSDNVTYCVTNVESIDLQPVPLLEIGENGSLGSMKAILTQINQENKGDDASDNTEDFERPDDDVANESDNEDDDVSDDTDDFELPDDVANESDESSINSDQDVTKHSKKKKKCLVCGKMYISEGPYNRHMKTHENDGNPDAEVENGTEKHTTAKRECTHCGKMYSSQSALNRHLKKLKEKKAIGETVDKTQMAGTSTVEGETTGDQGNNNVWMHSKMLKFEVGSPTIPFEATN